MLNLIPQNCRIVVTGGAGFIGSALTETLLSAGSNTVVCVDNFSTGSRKNIADFLQNAHFILEEGDICDESFMCRVMQGADYVFHEAALGSVPRSMEHPAESLRVNISGTASVFHAAALANVKRLVYASSSSVYGDEMTLPKVEYRTGNALSPYALSKQVDEQLAAQFAKIYGLNCVGLRYFNVFGRRQNPNGAYAAVIPKFTASLLAHNAPVINGSGQISRDFTYVDDVVQANLRALTKENICGEVFNIASSREISLDDLFYALRDGLAQWDPAIGKIEPLYGSSRPGDIPRSLANIGKARELLGYEPRFSFADAIRETLRWYVEKSGFAIS